LLWLKVSGIVASLVAGVVVLLGPSASIGPAAGRPAATGTATAAPGAGARAATRARDGNTALIGTSFGGSVPTASLSALTGRLSARQLAGQRVIYSYRGLTPPAGLLSLIRHGDAAGVIFFASNYRDRTQFDHAVSKLIRANAYRGNPARKYPLLLMTDQEGGLVRRLPGPPRLSEKQIGAIQPLSAAERAARQAGAGAAANLRGYRLNVNLAPVLDVYRAAGDFDDQFQRSYSERPGVASALGAAFVRGQQAGHVAASAKHFPGLGAATALQNTDKVAVTLNVPARILESSDEYPYRAAIKAGATLVMVSWARYPALDRRFPAGLSAAIVQGQLRGRLGFTGITITDAIGAGALRAFGSLQHRSVLAAKAGMDLILASSQQVTQGSTCLAGLETGYRSGALSKAAFTAAVIQILALRASLPT
jgi:beta-N-acetylhexosaminidase